MTANRTAAERSRRSFLDYAETVSACIGIVLGFALMVAA